MLRETLLFLSESRLARRMARDAPFANSFARRFVPGERVDDAARAVAELNQASMSASLDYLGEAVQRREEATAYGDVVLRVLDRIADSRLDANVSVKLTALGQDIDDAFLHDNTLRLLERAEAHQLFVRFDMEGSPYTQRTLVFFHKLWDEGHTGCGVVIQSYLHRSEADIAQLNEMGVRVRLCKGAYSEPASIAFPRKSEVDGNYVRLMKMLLDHGNYPGIATHDEAMIRATMSYAREHDIAPDRFEFQMLYGVRRDLQQRVVRQGFRLRVYVPFGGAWYPYFMRRLAERPANVVFILGNVLREAWSGEDGKRKNSGRAVR
jgi:proline dehydrogenase